MSDQSEEVLAFLKGLLTGFLDIEEEALTNETSIASLNMESLDFIEIQVEFEKKYAVKLRPSLFEKGQITTIGEFIDYVAAELSKRAETAVEGVASATGGE